MINAVAWSSREPLGSNADNFIPLKTLSMTEKHEATLSTRRSGFVGRRGNASTTQLGLTGKICSKGRPYFQDGG